MADDGGSIWQSRSQLFAIYLHSGLVMRASCGIEVKRLWSEPARREFPPRTQSEKNKDNQILRWVRLY